MLFTRATIFIFGNFKFKEPKITHKKRKKLETSGRSRTKKDPKESRRNTKLYTAMINEQSTTKVPRGSLATQSAKFGGVTNLEDFFLYKVFMSTYNLAFKIESNP